MIPDNITKEHIEQAIAYIEKNGVPPNRKSTGYILKYKGKEYPPKYVISIANKFASGKKLESEQFTGGKKTNNFLIQRGFEITRKSEKKEPAEKNDIVLKEEPVTQEQIQLNPDNLTIMRSRILSLLKQIDPIINGNESVAGRINRLAREDKIPREAAPWFRTITEMRNVVEYEGRELTENDKNVVLASWNAIMNWANENGYSLENLN